MNELDGLKVLEVATGVAGPYAGRLLAMLGATVVKLEPAGGDPARRLPVDDRALGVGPSPVFIHLNAGKELRSVEDVEGELDERIVWADVVVDDRVRRERDGTVLDPTRLRHAGKVIVSITAWGYDAEHPGEPADELLVQAASGMVQATFDDGRPYRFPGWQSQYTAGAYGVAGLLAAMSFSPAGRGHHVDVSWVGAILTGVEAGVCAHFHTAEQPTRPPMTEAGGRDRQAGFQVGAFPAGAFRCKDGHVIPGTVRPIDWDLQCAVYDRKDLLDDERFNNVQRFTHRDELRAELQPWYDDHTKTEIFTAALDAGWACGMVMTAGDALDDPHLAARGFLGDVVVDGVTATVPVRSWLTTVSASTGRLPRRHLGSLDALKVIELTWAWAGPFVGRFLGAYGADVVRIEAGRYPDGWRTRLKWKQTGLLAPDGQGPDDYTWDAAALHNTLGRNKRSLSLDLTLDEGRSLFVELLAHADLLVLNMSYRMLADRGVEDDVRAAVDGGLVVVNMPALGATGPYRDMPGYGILMEGMGGFAARYGSREDGARATNTYYPDLVAGLHGTIAALSGLARRRSTGAGSLVDLSQQEATWLQAGEALALRSMEGRDPGRLGDGEPGLAPSGYYPALGREWVAVVVRDEVSWAGLAPLLGDTGGWSSLDAAARCTQRDSIDAAVSLWTSARSADDAVTELRASGVSAEVARSYDAVFAGGVLAERGLLERLVHPVTAERPYLALPVAIDGSPWRSHRPAARFGEHTDEVLSEWLGLDADRIAALRAADVVGTVPAARRR